MPLRFIPLLILFAAGCGGGIAIDRPLSFPDGSWRQFSGNGSRTGIAKTGVQPPLELAWQESVNSSLGPAAVISSDGMLCIPALNGYVYLLDAESGAERGHLGLRGSMYGGPAGCDSLLLLPHSTFPATLTCVDLQAKKVRWTKAVGQIESSLLLSGGEIYAATLEGNLVRVSLRDSVTRWTVTLPKAVYSSPATDGERIFAGCNDGSVYAFRADSGTQSWKHSTGAAVMASPIVGDGTIYIGSTGGQFLALNARDGTTRWTIDLAAPIYSAAALSGDEIYIGTTGHSLFALDAATGAVRWRAATGGVIRTPVALTENHLFVASLDKTIRCLDRRTGREIWSSILESAPVAPPLLTGDRLIVTTESGEVYAFRAAERK